MNPILSQKQKAKRLICHQIYVYLIAFVACVLGATLFGWWWSIFGSIDSVFGIDRRIILEILWMGSWLLTASSGYYLFMNRNKLKTLADFRWGPDRHPILPWTKWLQCVSNGLIFMSYPLVSLMMAVSVADHLHLEDPLLWAFMLWIGGWMSLLAIDIFILVKGAKLDRWVWSSVYIFCLLSLLGYCYYIGALRSWIFFPFVVAFTFGGWDTVRRA